MAVTKQIDVVVSAQDEYSGIMDRFIESVSGIGIAAIAAETAILALSTAASYIPLKIGKEFFDTAVDYHDAMLDIHAVAQSVGTSQEEISDVLDKLVIKWPLTGASAGEAMEMIAQKGYGTADAMMSITDATEELAIATSTDLQVATTTVLTIMNQYGIELKDIKDITNILAAAQFNTAASVADFGEAMKYAGPIAKLAGIEFNELATFMAMLRNNGLEASQMGTTLRVVIASLLKETEKGSIALAKYGLTYAEVNPSVVGLTGVVKAFGGQTVSAEDAVRIFNVRGAIFASIINKGATEAEALTATITGTSAAVDGAASKMEKWDTVLNMIVGDIDALKNAFEKDLVLAVESVVGLTSTEGIRGMIAQIKKLEEEFGYVSTIMLDTFKFIRDLGEDLFGRTFGDATGLYETFSSIFDLLTTNMKILASWGSEFLELLHGMVSDGNAFQTIFTVLNTLAVAFLTPLAMIHDILATYAFVFGNSVDWWEYLIRNVISEMMDQIIRPIAWANEFIGLGLDDTINDWRAASEKWSVTLDEAFDTDKPNYWTDNVIRGYSSAQEAIDNMGTSHEKYSDRLVSDNAALWDFSDAYGELEVAATDSLAAMRASSAMIQSDFEGINEEIGNMTVGLESASTSSKAVAEDFEIMAVASESVSTEVAQFSERIDDAGVKTIVWKGNVEDTASAMSGVGDEVKKVGEKLSELEKHELKLEIEQFKASAAWLSL